MKGLVSTGMLQVGAATGTESSWERDPELLDTFGFRMGYQHSLALQGWAVPGMAAPILLGTAFQGVLDPIPSTRTQPGSREPACPIPDSSFTGETLPEQSFAELSFHGIPGGASLEHSQGLSLQDPKGAV